MWISNCGKPASACDGSDSDCWLMECGYITCVGECVRVPVAHHKHHEFQHQTLHSLWGEQMRRNQASWLIVDCRLPRNTLYLLLSSFTPCSPQHLQPRVKGRSFHSTLHGGVVAMREALSCHLCFLHLLAGFAVRLTTTHPFESIKVWWNCDTDSDISVQDYTRY